MKIAKVTIITLGVSNLEKSTEFYKTVLETPPTITEGITFIQLPGVWVALYPCEKLAEDISSNIETVRKGFNGFTLAHNAQNKEEVIDILKLAESAGGKIVKEPQETFWGGFSGYFSDPDGFYWEVAWGPMFDFNENGDMKLKY
jgi:predicted lactoylglutathione lyase